MNTIRMRTMKKDQVADGVDLGLEDHLPSVQLLSLCVLVLMVAEMKMLTKMMRMGVEVVIKIIMITMKMMTIMVSQMVTKK